MITDSIYLIGHDHRVCQDYALHGIKGWDKPVGNGVVPVGYGIISDGCSASPDVDVGARLLALNYCAGISPTEKREHWESGLPLAAYQKSLAALTGTGLSTAALDATLLSVVQNEKEIFFSIFGDGYLFFMERHDPRRLHVQRYEYSENTPYYLSLEHGGSGIQHDFAAFPQRLEVTHFEFDQDGGQSSYTTVHPSTARLTLGFPAEDILFAGVASDGWGTFYHRDSGQQVALQTVFREFHEFPVVTDEFLTRRVTKMLKGFDRMGFRHFDDLSMAVIHNGETS